MAKQNTDWQSSTPYKVGDIIDSKRHGGKVIITGEGTSSRGPTRKGDIVRGPDGKLTRIGKIHTANSKTKAFVRKFIGRKKS